MPQLDFNLLLTSFCDILLFFYFFYLFFGFFFLRRLFSRIVYKKYLMGILERKIRKKNLIQNYANEILKENILFIIKVKKKTN